MVSQSHSYHPHFHTVPFFPHLLKGYLLVSPGERLRAGHSHPQGEGFHPPLDRITPLRENPGFKGQMNLFNLDPFLLEISDRPWMEGQGGTHRGSGQGEMHGFFVHCHQLRLVLQKNFGDVVG